LLGGILRAAAACVAILAAATAHAEFVRVSAANAVGNSVYDVTSFAPPSGATTPLNSDGSSHGSFSSLVLVANVAAGTVDVLVADACAARSSAITPAVGATAASERVVWSSSGTGPAHPDGLSVDGAGNLYMVTSKLNDNTTSAVWVLPPVPPRQPATPQRPLLIDATFATANGVKVLQESVVATTTTAAWNVGDLLVLVGNGAVRTLRPIPMTPTCWCTGRRASAACSRLGAAKRAGPDHHRPQPVSGGGVPARHGFLAARCTLRQYNAAGSLTTAPIAVRLGFSAADGGRGRRANLQDPPVLRAVWHVAAQAQVGQEFECSAAS